MTVPTKPSKKLPISPGTLFSIFVAGVFIVVSILGLLGVVPKPWESRQILTLTAMATFTPSATQQKVAVTNTPEATATPVPAPTATQIVVPEITPMPYVMHGFPQGLPNSLYRNQYSCDQIFIIGGNVVDMFDHGVEGVTVALTGSYGKQKVDMKAISGKATLYGFGGFEFLLDNEKVNENELFIQLF